MSIAPRSKTGLIPTIHRENINRKSSVDQWSRLPPRPPPEMFQYRGDFIVSQRRQRTKSKKPFCHNQSSQKNLIMKRDKKDGNRKSPGRNGTTTAKVRKSKTKNPWDCYSQNLDDHKITIKEKELKDSSRNEYLSYIRKSAMKRELLEHLSMKLDSEIASDGAQKTLHYDDNDSSSSVDSCRHLEDNFCSIKESILSRLDSLENTKPFSFPLLNSNQQDDLDHSVSETSKSKREQSRMNDVLTKKEEMQSTSTNTSLSVPSDEGLIHKRGNTPEENLSKDNANSRSSPPSLHVTFDRDERKIKVFDYDDSDDESAWDCITEKQRFRIRKRMEELYQRNKKEQHFTDQANYHQDIIIKKDTEVSLTPRSKRISVPMNPHDNDPKVKNSNGGLNLNCPISTTNDHDLKTKHQFQSVGDDGSTSCISDLVHTIAQSLFVTKHTSTKTMISSHYNDRSCQSYNNFTKENPCIRSREDKTSKLDAYSTRSSRSITGEQEQECLITSQEMYCKSKCEEKPIHPYTLPLTEDSKRILQQRHEN